MHDWYTQGSTLRKVPHLGAHADAILKFLILSEPWPPPFHFALGPASYVAHRAFDRIFYFLFSPFLASTLCSWHHATPQALPGEREESR